MAGFAARGLQPFVAMRWSGEGSFFLAGWMAGGAVRLLAVHLQVVVTIDAGHTALAEMDVGFEALVLAKVFITDPAAMAGRAGPRHGRRADEIMAVQQPASYAGGLADVALAAGRMALIAVIAHHLLDMPPGFGVIRIRSGGEGGFVALQRSVQAVDLRVDQVGMALAAGRFWLGARVCDEVRMSGLLVGIVDAAVAARAGNLGVG